MVAAAKARAGATNALVQFEQARADTLPFPDETFDTVTAVTVLCFIDDTDRAMREMVRVLRPGGRLVLGELGRISLWALLRRIRGWLGSATWRAARFRTPGELSALAERAGLSEIKISGAIFYPPIGIAALLMGRLDRFIGKLTRFGAAFLSLVARKTDSPSSHTIRGHWDGRAGPGRGE
jgi:SAM-dependent methyltransferase